MARQKQLPAKWRKLLTLLPGYDPTAQAGECWFAVDAAERALRFMQTCLKHVEGKLAGKPFALEPWQQAIVANLFGWMRPDGSRRYRECFVYVPRKNGKTPLAAAICLYVLFCDGEAGAQIYGAAADREQAALLFRQASGMVRQCKSLDKRARVYEAHKSIVLRDDQASSYRVLSAEADTKHGGTSHLVIVDELHAQPNRELVDVLQTSFASSNRRQPVLLSITTADWLRESICNEKYEVACRVRDNKGDPHAVGYDPAFLPVIYEAAPDDDWKSEDTWRKCNPNLDVSVSLDYLRRECRTAQEVPAYENTFRRLHCNQRTESDSRAIPSEQWAACGHGADPVAWHKSTWERLRGHTCVAGLDLGSTSDLTALVLLFDQEPVPRPVLPVFWVTEAAIERRRRDRVPYDAWVAQGFLRVTPGNVTDYDLVRRDLNQIGQTFGIRELAVDRLFQGAQLCTQLQDDGFNVKEFGQGFLSMALPTKRLLELIAGAQIDHGNNPPLAWQAGNAVTRDDEAGNQKFDKKRSAEKIDGIVALAMAVGLAEQNATAYSGGVEVW